MLDQVRTMIYLTSWACSHGLATAPHALKASSLHQAGRPCQHPSPPHRLIQHSKLVDGVVLHMNPLDLCQQDLIWQGPRGFRFVLTAL